MFVDRSVRYLSCLRGVSTSRVLNLGASGCAVGNNGAPKAPTLFHSPVLGRAILVKHRVRRHEEFLFGYHLGVATKIIVPANAADLTQGGESFFVDQRGFKHKLREIGRYPNGGLDADCELLQRLADLPALDVFLARAHLQSHGIEVPGGCLELEANARRELEQFAANELIGFVRVVLGGEVEPGDPMTSRLVRALLVNRIGPELEPLRAALGLDQGAFGRAILAWRGVLYCKWQLRNARAQIPQVLAGLQQLRTADAGSGSEPAARQMKTAVAEGILASLKCIRQLLGRYESAYREFVEHGRPVVFREFLMDAPGLSRELAQKTGAISHILTFWRCRFPTGISGAIADDELCAMLQDFQSGAGPTIRGRRNRLGRSDSLRQFEAVAGGTADKEAPQPLCLALFFYTRARRHDFSLGAGKIVHQKTHMALAGRRGLRIEADMKLKRPNLKPGAATSAQLLRFGNFRKAQHRAVEGEAFGLQRLRHRNLDVVDAGHLKRHGCSPTSPLRLPVRASDC